MMLRFFFVILHADSKTYTKRGPVQLLAKQAVGVIQ